MKLLGDVTTVGGGKWLVAQPARPRPFIDPRTIGFRAIDRLVVLYGVAPPHAGQPQHGNKLMAKTSQVCSPWAMTSSVIE